MGEIKVSCEINDYSNPKKPNICIHNHWNYNDFVEIEVPEVEGRFTVNGKDFKMAIDNCMNSKRC